MRYEMLRPGQIQDAIARGLPLLMPTGVLEYHGPQNPVGTDALIAQGLVQRVEAQVECVVAPTMFYGYTGEWAAGIEQGEIHVGGDGIYGYVKPILSAFFRQGWQRIYVVCHHQGPTGVTMLSYQRAATEAGMEYALEQNGPGWHAREDLYPRVFNRIFVVGDSDYATTGFGGHGGKGETDAMLYYYPETVDLGQLGEDLPRWALDAHEANAEDAREIGDALVASWVAELKRVATA